MLLIISAVAMAVLVSATILTLKPVQVSQDLLDRQSTVALFIGDKPTHYLKGIGASGAWWSDPVYALGPSVRSRVGELLYGSHGLRLSQFRFNIGGGGVGVTTWWKAPPSFYQGDGQFNYSLDQQAVYFLEQAKRYGVKDLVGFVNSAPPQFTSNHRSCGGTLIAADIPAYAMELADLVAGIRSHFGVELNYVSPMNEPVGSQAACRQEGMAVPVSERGPLVVALARDLSQVAPWCHVIADESAFVRNQFLTQVPVWLKYPGAHQAVAALAFHGYDYPTAATLAKVAQLSDREHLPVWATEICCYDDDGFGYQYDPTMASGMWLASTIYQDLMVAKASAFDWWIALSPDLGCSPVADPGCFSDVNVLGRNDGLIYFDLNGPTNGDRRLYLTKRYYVLGNFSRYLRPGMGLVKVSTSDARVEAMAGIRRDELVLVVIDFSPSGSGPLPLTIQFPPDIRPVSVVATLETSSNRNWAPIGRPTISGHLALAISYPYSVTTYVFRVANR